MIRTTLLTATLALSPVAAFAQSEPVMRDMPAMTEPVEIGPVLDRRFYLLSGALVASAIYDAETTIQGLENCRSCREANPVARVFTDGGRPATYAFALGTSAALIWISYRWKEQGRRFWWAPLVAGTIVHGAAGTANLRFVNE